MKICVVGAGRWGKNHVKTLSDMGNLGGVVDGSPITRQKLQADYPGLPVFASLDEQGAMDFEAYTVAVPAEYHHPVGLRLLEAGKHVLIEKPITLNSKDARHLNKVAKEKNLVLMTGHLLLFHPAIRKIKELLDTGKLGKLQYIYSNRLNLGTVRTEENSLWSFAPHDISIFQYFVGQNPVNVSSNGGAFLQPHIHDTTLTVISYPENIVGHIFVSWLHPFKEHRMVVIGSKGMVSFEDSSENKDLLFYEKGIDWVNGEPVKRDGATQAIDYPKDQPLRLEMQHFLDAIAGAVPNNLISGIKGEEVLDILEKAEIQLHSKTTKPAPVAATYAFKDVFIHPTVNVDTGAQIGEGSKVWNFSNVQKNAVIGKKCILGQNVNVAPNVRIGNFCKIQNNVSVYEGVELEDYVFCGPSMVFTNIKNPRCKYPQAESKFYIKTLVREGASIGANATIVCGVTLGRFSFVGAGAVVTKDVPDYGVVVGNPAKLVGWSSEAGTMLDFSEQSDAFCPKSNRWYQLSNGIVTDITALKQAVPTAEIGVR